MEEEKIFILKKNAIGKAKDPKIFHYLLKISKNEDKFQCDIIDKLDDSIIETFLLNNDKETLVNFDEWYKSIYLKYSFSDVHIIMGKGTYKLYSHLKAKHNYTTMN